MKSNKTQLIFLDISLILCVLLRFVLISQPNTDILKTESKKYVSNAFLICLATNHKLQSVYKKEKMIMSNEMKQKAVKAVPNRWFVFCILTLSGGIAFKLSSMKDMFYVPMQQFMGLTNTQIGGALSAYGIVQTIGLIFGIYICDMFSKKYMIGGSLIGLGAIGVLVANAATHLGMEVYGYDPYVSVDSAWRLSRSIHHTKNVDEIYKECDYITIHVPALEDTKGMINKNAISLMKEGVVILNFARDVLVNSEDIVDALVGGKVGRYVTDFPTPEIAGVKHAIVIPHLGASTAESEDNCAKMAVEELKDFLENGNIRNSVNFPACDMGVRDKTRITILHRNIPNMIGQFTALLAKDNVNIDDMTNKSRGSYAYTMIDVDNDVTEDVVKGLEMIEGVLKVRVIA